MNFILGKRAATDWFKWLHKVAVMDNHVLVDGCLSKIQNQIYISMQSTETALKSSEFKLNSTIVDRNSGDQINSTCNIHLGFFFFNFYLIFSRAWKWWMMASDSWNHLLFTSHSRTNDQLQDKWLTIIMLFLTVAPKSRSKELNVQMPTWAWDWLFRSKSTFLEQRHHTKVVKGRKRRLHSILSFILNFWSHFHTKRFLSKCEEKSTYGLDHGLGVCSRAAERAVCDAGVGADSKED